MNVTMWHLATAAALALIAYQAGQKAGATKALQAGAKNPTGPVQAPADWWSYPGVWGTSTGSGG